MDLIVPNFDFPKTYITSPANNSVIPSQTLVDCILSDTQN